MQASARKDQSSAISVKSLLKLLQKQNRAANASKKLLLI